MKIAFIASNRTSSEGGSEALWSKTALYALKQGHEIVCVVYDWKVPHHMQAKLEDSGAIIIRRKLRGLHKPLRQRIFLKFRHLLLSKLFGEDYEFSKLKKYSPDLVCLSQGGAYDHAYQPSYEVLFKYLACPYFILAHAYSDDRFISKTFRKSSLKVLNGASQVFFVAQRQRDVIERQLLHKLSNACIVNNPLNLALNESVLYPESATVMMAMVGALGIRWKGHDLILEALSAEEWRSRDWRLSIYGEGADQENIEELINYYLLKDKVTLKGFQPDMGKVWAEHQILLMPSRVESAPLTVCEAMLCARPVLTTDIGDMAAYYEEGVSGFLAAAPNAKYLGQALNRMWDQRIELREMGLEARKRMEKKFDHRAEERFLEIMISKVNCGNDKS